MTLVVINLIAVIGWVATATDLLLRREPLPPSRCMAALAVGIMALHSVVKIVENISN